MPGNRPLLTLHRHRITDIAGNGGETLSLAGSRLIHPDPGRMYRVRHGLLRVSELLDGGREITRAVLRSGAGFSIGTSASEEADPVRDTYPVDRMIIMALDRTEVIHTTVPSPEGKPNHHVRD